MPVEAGTDLELQIAGIQLHYTPEGFFILGLIP